MLKNVTFAKGRAVHTTPLTKPTVKFPCPVAYRKTIPYTQEFAEYHKLGDWGEWIELPFIFIPAQNTDGEWVWGRGICIQYKPHGVSFQNETLDVSVRYDRKKDIFIRKLRK